ncbi:hypothetical protein ACFYSC_27305 [Streptosporangium sp. NPDC004379]|uniref:hypothetical protein n=1 Tax=Streptosporangium sp. NPDC004379 TaxID=3366189 RepID=UPI0036C29B80
MRGLDDIDWETLSTSPGTAAEELPSLLRAIAAGEEAGEAFSQIEFLLFNSEDGVHSASSAALPFLVTLAEDIRVTVRTDILRLVGEHATNAVHAVHEDVDPGWAPAWDAAVPRLLALLDDPDPAVRRALTEPLSAAVTFADLVAPALRRRWAAEQDRAVRLSSVIAVGFLTPGCTVGVLIDSLAWLRGLCSDADAQVRLAATVVLSRVVRGQRLGADLATLLDALGEADLRVWQDVPWIGALPQNPGVDLAAFVGDIAARVVLRADALLGEDLPARTELCLSLMTHRDAGHREGAVRAAAEVLCTWRSPAERLLPALAGRTTDEVAKVRAYATHVLAAMSRAPTGDAPVYGGADLLAARLEDDRPVWPLYRLCVADIAAWGLVWLSDRRGLPRLVERIEADDDGYAGVDDGSWYSGWPPRLRHVLGPVPQFADDLLPVIRARLTDEAGRRETVTYTQVLAEWGGVAAPAVPELVALLDTDAQLPAAEALGRIGPAAAEAVPVIERFIRRPREFKGYQDRLRARAVLPWARQRITGEPGTADVPFEEITHSRLWPFVAELGGEAEAAHLRVLLDHRDPEVRVDAAYALFRLTGDYDAVRWTLWMSAREERTSLRWTALRYLAEMGRPVSYDGGWIRREILDEERLHHHTPMGWRAFAEDRELRVLAARLLGEGSPQ